jgi:hypothetical protein
VADTNVMDALQQLLQKGVDASQAEQRRTVLDEVRDKDPDDWDDREWDFANERGLIPADRQGEYELKLLEKRQAAERANLLAWQGGNNPLTGTATVGVASGQIPSPPQNPTAATLGMEVQEVDSHEEAPAGADDRPYEERSYPELKKLAKGRGLDTSGTQDDLVERLKYDDETS